jgi:hypothetical protein
MLESMTGVFYVAIVISRLVALYSSSVVSAEVPALSACPSAVCETKHKEKRHNTYTNLIKYL